KRSIISMSFTNPPNPVPKIIAVSGRALNLPSMKFEVAFIFSNIIQDFLIKYLPFFIEELYFHRKVVKHVFKCFIQIGKIPKAYCIFFGSDNNFLFTFQLRKLIHDNAYVATGEVMMIGKANYINFGGKLFKILGNQAWICNS